MAHSLRAGRPTKSYDKWIARIPETYYQAVLESPLETPDPHSFGLLKHYLSLMPMASEVRKPIFHLKPADGAIGSHLLGVQRAGQDFKMLTEKILERAGIAMSTC